MGSRTVGVVIAVPEPHGSTLRDARRSFGDPQADVVPTHITLLPPTAVEVDALPCVGAHLREVAAVCAPFEVILRGVGTFRPVSPVVFVRLVAGAQECADLAARVRKGPLDRPLDFPYHPHVTVAHHLDDAALDQAARGLADLHVAFPVGELVLYTQEDGAWHRESGFALTGPTPAADS